MAFEYSFAKAGNHVEVAQHIAKSNHTWATEEEEYYGEVGYDLLDGRFTEAQIEELSVYMHIDNFAAKVEAIRATWE